MSQKEKNAEALRMRREGMKFKAIGEHFGVSQPRAHQMVSAALKEEVAVPDFNASVAAAMGIPVP